MQDFLGAFHGHVIANLAQLDEAIPQPAVNLVVQVIASFLPMTDALFLLFLAEYFVAGGLLRASQGRVGMPLMNS